MEDEKFVLQDTQPDEELDLALIDDEENQEEEVEKAETTSEVDWKAKAEELEAKNRQLYARLKKEPAEKKPQVNSKPENEDSDWRRKMEFVTTKGRNLDADDIDEVIAYARGKGISYEEALDSNVIKSHLRVKQAREKIANATPQSSSKSTVINGKTWAEMSEEERRQNYTKSLNLKKRA